VSAASADSPLLFQLQASCRTAANRRLADKRLPHCSKPCRYSMTSSALASSTSGTVRSSTLAILRLTTRSYLVRSCTGRSHAINVGLGPRTSLSAQKLKRKTTSRGMPCSGVPCSPRSFKRRLVGIPIAIPALLAVSGLIILAADLLSDRRLIVRSDILMLMGAREVSPCCAGLLLQ
jgi:hypothetical protein